jgi:hypothetical protein
MTRGSQRKKLFPNHHLPLLLAFTDSAITLLKLLVIGYGRGRQPFPFVVPIYLTIFTDLRVSYDFHMHISLEQS